MRWNIQLVGLYRKTEDVGEKKIHAAAAAAAAAAAVVVVVRRKLFVSNDENVINYCSISVAITLLMPGPDPGMISTTGGRTQQGLIQGSTMHAVHASYNTLLLTTKPTRLWRPSTEKCESRFC